MRRRLHPPTRRRTLGSRRRPLSRRPQRRGRVVAIAGLGLAGAAAGLAAMIWTSNADSCADCDEPDVAMTIVYTAPTANSSAYTVDPATTEALTVIGQDHRSVRLVRVDGDGSVSTDVIDLTPRVSPDEDSDVLKVPARADEAIQRSIDGIERRINETAATAPGHALLTGLTTLNLDPSIPLTIVSTGLDTTDPADFRRLAFDVAPTDLVTALESAGELPALPGADVTFVMLRPAGPQAPLRQPHQTYVTRVWQELLTAAGASRVEFVTPDPAPAAARQEADTVPIPAAPGTPVRPEEVATNTVSSPTPTRTSTCRLASATFFEPDRATLLDRAATLQALQSCVAQVRAATVVDVEGHTATVNGGPNSPAAVALSLQRAQVVAELLVELGVGQDQITRIHGSGNANPPYPDPEDPRNRCVVVTFTTPEEGALP